MASEKVKQKAINNLFRRYRVVTLNDLGADLLR